MLVGWVRIYRLAVHVKKQQPQTAAFLGRAVQDDSIK
jgi:hypothetical protein